MNEQNTKTVSFFVYYKKHFFSFFGMRLLSIEMKEKSHYLMMTRLYTKISFYVLRK